LDIEEGATIKVRILMQKMKHFCLAVLMKFHEKSFFSSLPLLHPCGAGFLH
jgi:hypothetical protein